MFGIRGLDGFGLVHGIFGLLALVFGLAVFLQRKGTPSHRNWGYAYAVSMLLLNVTALVIYDLFGRFGPFHYAAVFSLATVLAATVPAMLKRPAAWLDFHAMFMSWSYVGLVAAFIAEIAVRVPGVAFGAGTIFSMILAVAGGAVLIHTRVPKLITRLRAPPPVSVR